MADFDRAALVEYGKKLVNAGLTKGTGGNLSLFDRERGLMAITPSGIDFFDIRESDIVVMDSGGEVVEGSRTPSSEWQMHLETYLARPDIDAVIHAHTMYATVLACLREPLPATHYMVAVAGVDVPVAEYATYGTPELAHNAVKAMKGRRAVLLANHGILAGANDGSTPSTSWRKSSTALRSIASQRALEPPSSCRFPRWRVCSSDSRPMDRKPSTRRKHVSKVRSHR